jgi:ribosome-associated heat shock protein Hsp15
MRLDKWLWAARFYKTRSLAQRAITAGQVRQNEERVKPAHDVKVGDVVSVRKENLEWIVAVRALADQRRGAEEARKLYEETAESRAERERRGDLRRWGTEPARDLKGRPTKRDRRLMEQLPVLEPDPPHDGEA